MFVLWPYGSSLLLIKCCSALSAGNRRNDRQIVALLYRSILFSIEVTNIFVVQVDIYEGAQLAIVGVEVPLQIRMLCCELRKRVAHRRGAHIDRGLFGGILPKWCRNMNLHLVLSISRLL